LSGFASKDPAFQARVQASFAKQGLMTTLGASIVHVAPGTAAGEKLVALLTATLMTIEGREGVND